MQWLSRVMLKLLIENTLVKVVGMEKGYKILGNYIRLVDERNRDLAVTKLLGVSISKKFIPSIANIVGTDLSNYKIVRTGQFAYGPVTSRNGEKISIAYLDEEDCIISSSYTVFEVENKEELDPEYLMLWFSRPEFDRYARYKSHGSVREIFDWNELCMVELPVPDIEKQRRIVKAYKTITDRIDLKQKINDNLDEQLKILFKSWFVDFEPFKNSLVQSASGNYIPIGWIETTLGEYVSYAQGTQVPVEEQYSTATDKRVRFLRIVDYTGNTSDEPRYIDVKPKNSVCSPEEILIIRYGASAGQICRGLAGVFANNLFSITPSYPISNSYLYYLLNQPTVQSFITSVGETSSAMPALTHGLISSIPITLPNNTELLDKFKRTADVAFSQQMLNNDEMAKLKVLRDSLLAKLSSR